MYGAFGSMVNDLCDLNANLLFISLIKNKSFMHVTRLRYKENTHAG